MDFSKRDLKLDDEVFIDSISKRIVYILFPLVKYRCIGRIIPDDTKRARVCENHKMSLECPERRNIDIVWANFGRLKGAHICGDGFFGVFSWNQACQHQVASKAIAKQYCQDKEHCLLDATVAKFGDACWGTKKYLEVGKEIFDFEFQKVEEQTDMLSPTLYQKKISKR